MFSEPKGSLDSVEPYLKQNRTKGQELKLSQNAVAPCPAVSLPHRGSCSLPGLPSPWMPIPLLNSQFSV